MQTLPHNSIKTHFQIFKLVNFQIKKLIKMTVSLLVLTILTSHQSSAQEIEWQNTIGGSGDDQLYSIQQTTDGGYILGGYSSSDISGDKTENTMSGDYWIVKTDAVGNIIWQETIGGDVIDHLISIEQTSDGGYILGGYSASNVSGDKTENCLGGWDFWIIKTDSVGSIQWQNTIGGSLADYLYTIEQTSDGGFILGGSSKSNISGDKTENGFGLEDYWIVKIDSNGNVEWQKTFGGSSHDILKSVKQTSDGGFVLGGMSRSNISVNKSENCLGYDDYWVIKTDGIGNIEWENTIGGIWNDYFSSVFQASDGGFILGGASESTISGDKTQDNIGLLDFWIIKIMATSNWRD
jgi:hypothetical protein